MHFHLCLPNMSPSAVLHDYVATKRDRLGSLVAEILAINLVILRHEHPPEGGTHCAKARVVVSGPDLHASGVGHEPRVAIDRVSATLAAQLRKRKRVLLPAPAADTGGGGRGMKTRVLLVDDDPAVVSALGNVLSEEGYEVVYARNGREAIDECTQRGPLGLILLDLCMPVMGGWDAFERLSAMDPARPIVVITARLEQRPLAEAAGVDALLEKPLDIPQLLETIQMLLAESSAARLTRIATQSRGSFQLQRKKRRNLGKKR